MSLAKLPELEILSIYMCKKRSSADLSYISLSGSKGFPKLKVFDLRFSGLGDMVIKSMYKNGSLQQMYFQHYERTYRLDKCKREVEILEGEGKVREFSYIDNMVDVNDTDSNFMQKYFGDGKFVINPSDPVTDTGMFTFKNMEPEENVAVIGDSLLFEPLYGECKCDFHKKFWGNFVYSH